MALILVRGTGDVGSAVAHALFRAGHCVILHDMPMPAHPRRGMSYADALFNGTMTEADAMKRLVMVAALLLILVALPSVVKKRMAAR